MKSYFFFALFVIISSCQKHSEHSALHYYEIGFKTNMADWRDQSFVIATADRSLISEIKTQLKLPVSQRKIVNGLLLAGSGGYNKNGTHEFKWHFKENDWKLAELSAEIFDGRPYNDLDTDIDYWLNTVKRFAPWGSYIKKETTRP